MIGENTRSDYPQSVHRPRVSWRGLLLRLSPLGRNRRSFLSQTELRYVSNNSDDLTRPVFVYVLRLIPQ